MGNASKIDPRETELQLASMREMLTIVGSGGDLRETLERIARCACELLQADNGTIGLVDRAARSVRIEAAYRMPPDEIGSVTPFGVGLAGRVAEGGGPLLVEQYRDLSPRARSDVDENAVIGVPIEWEGTIIGTFGLGKVPPGRFSERDAERLSSFAGYAAIVIRHAQLLRRSGKAVGELQTLYRTSRSISQAMDIDEVVAAYLDQVATYGEFACSVIVYEQGETGIPEWRVQRGRWAPGEGMTLTPLRWRHSPDALDVELDLGREVTLADVFSDERASEELRSIQAESGRAALAMIPLMVRGKRIGLVVLSHPQARDWQPAELEPYRATAILLAAAIDRRDEHWTSIEKDRRLALLGERQRIARELHDSVSQTLFGVLLLAQSAAESATNELRSKLDRLVEVSQRALGDMREIVSELRPESESAVKPRIDQSSLMDLRNLGLVGALRKACVAASAAGIEVTLCADRYLSQDGDRELAMLRVGQEALSNSFRHARCTHVQVELSTAEGWSQLVVADDGKGFDVAVPGATGFGLTSMRDRVASLSGTLNVESTLGTGTRVRARLPEGR